MTDASALPVLVPAGADSENVHRSMGITTVAFKVTTAETGGDLFVIEQTNHAKGGPPRHIHPAQDEVFRVVEGDFVVAVGETTYRLAVGDSLLAPRGVPHVWAFVGEGTGRLIVTFAPAGKMEAFFREVTKTEAMPAQDPGLWLAHGMQVVGPPLAV
jgi:quercetin dioxygenase-like cupin family protein